VWILVAQDLTVVSVDTTTNFKSGFITQSSEILKDSVSPHICKNHSQFIDKDFPHSLHGAVLVLMVSTSNAAECNYGGFRDTILTGTGMELV
jgi:hypothetical protein